LSFARHTALAGPPTVCGGRPNLSICATLPGASAPEAHQPLATLTAFAEVCYYRFIKEQFSIISLV